MNKKLVKNISWFMVVLTVVAMLFVGCKEIGDATPSTEPTEGLTQPTELPDTTEPSVQETERPRKPGMYFVDILPTANGTVTANCTEAKEGDTITLTVTPDEGYEIVSLLVNDKYGESTFVMPSSDVTVLVRFGVPGHANGDFFGSAGSCHSSDSLNMDTDAGKNPYLVMDANEETPLFAYVKGISSQRFYLETTVKVTGVRSDEKYPKFGLMTNDGNDIVKFYMDMTTKKEVFNVGEVHQKNGGTEDWASQTSWKLNKSLDLRNQTVKLGLLRDGKNFYFYVNGQLVATGNDLSQKNSTTGIFSFGTSLKLTNYKLVQKESEINSLVNKAKADAKVFNGPTLTENFFNKTADGVYTLITNSDAQSSVDDVMVAGQTMQEKYYSMKGKLTLADAGDWGQARVLISGDAQNEHVIALEKMPDGNYQIFTMSNANENGWNNWTLIVDGVQNGNKNSLDFEIIVIEDQLYLVLDDTIYYTSSRVSMPKSTVKFSGCNVGTTTVENLSLEVFDNEAAAKAYVNTKQDRFGENFGVSQGLYWTSTGVDLSNDKGENPTIQFIGGAPQYAYLNDIFTDKFCFETEFNVTAVLNNDAYPKFGILTKDSKEMVKFFVDMSSAMTATHVGVVYQPNDGSDDWANSVTSDVAGMAFTGNDTIKLKVVRDGTAYYFYVNDELVLYNEEGFESEQCAVGVFSFNAALTASDYAIITGSAVDSALEQAQEDLEALLRLRVSTNYFEEIADGVYTLATNSDAQHLVDEVIVAGKTMHERYYSLKGKLSLTDAGDWGQARILISGDAQNEHVIALEKMPDGNYQIFTMSNANENGWNNWTLIVDGAQNGSRNSLDFEVIVIDSQVCFLIEDAVYYTSSRVSMSESTVKFSGCNVGTTTVEALSLEVFDDEAGAQAYLDTKQSRFGENFGVSQGLYWTSSGVDLTNDKGENSTIKFVGGAPQYAYLNDVFTDKFCFETEINVEAIINNDAYPKFGVMVNGSTEMVKFFVDMTSNMTATHVGVVYQPTDGDDDWASSVSRAVSGMAFTGSDTIKLKVVRNGAAYYFYVNDELILHDEEGFKDEKGAVGIFSFNTVLIASKYTTLIDADADQAIQDAQNNIAAANRLGLTCNWFTDAGNGVYTLTTNSGEEHKVDDLTRGGDVLRTAYYSVKGKLSLTNASDWGQARILISGDAQNEHVIALEKLPDGNYQIFTMSNANENGWNNWTLIVDGAQNGSRNSIDFEVIVIGNQLYFLIEDKVCYTSSRVAMTDSTVKFSGCNVGTTTVENLALEVFLDDAAANAYVNSKRGFGENFGMSQNLYLTSSSVDLTQDVGENPTIKFLGGAPQYAYLNDVYTDNFTFETEINVEAVSNNDAFPKFGLMVHGSSEMVKFFVDMTPDMTATHVGMVYQPTNGNDDWANSVSREVRGMSFTGSDTIKLKLVREGKAYYFYVNNQLVLYGTNGFKDEPGAVGIFSFNAVMTASEYTFKTGE